MKIKIKKLKDNAIIPKSMHKGDAALDIYSCIDINIQPGERVLIDTGISMAIPQGYFGNIRDRSGLAVKHGLHTMAGVVDSNYRGEIKIVIINLSKEEYSVKQGDRVAQMIIQEVNEIVLEEVEDLDSTERGGGGFGDSGY